MVVSKNYMVYPKFQYSLEHNLLIHYLQTKTEYATNEVVHGTKIIVRKNPLNRKSFLFRIQANTNATTSIMGT